MTFVTRRLEPRGGNDYRIVGDLTIRGITKESRSTAKSAAPSATRGATSAWA